MRRAVTDSDVPQSVEFNRFGGALRPIELCRLLVNEPLPERRQDEAEG
jgi:hypothetical protein